MINIAVFASGTGSNATKMVEYFKNYENINIRLIVSNKKDAPVLDMALTHNIPSCVVSRSSFYETEDILNIFNKYSIDYVVLAGFLWLIPSYIVTAYPDRIVNIHPALLPKYGGKGMYGMNVHRAVKEQGEKETGMTIHFVNEKYDEGNILFQAKVGIREVDTAADIQKKVLKLEHQYYSKVIEELVTKN